MWSDEFFEVSLPIPFFLAASGRQEKGARGPGYHGWKVKGLNYIPELFQIFRVIDIGDTGGQKKIVETGSN